MKQKIHKIKLCIISIALLTTSCSDFLDIVPDNVATIDYAFRMRSTALGYLSTCYSFLPDLQYPLTNAAFLGADEIWIDPYTYDSHTNSTIGRGLQNANNPVLDYWEGRNRGKNYWIAISQCNIFLENIVTVPDMQEWEIKQWIAEVKFLKAYYQFFLLRQYGPIPIMRENIPISASGEEVRVKREPVDSVFAYITELLDEAIVDLPNWVADESTELGRITKPIAMGVKAKILVYAASPLFNGNTDYANYKNRDEETSLFSQTYDESKWVIAADACKEAIDYLHSFGAELYRFTGTFHATDLSNETKIRMNSRAVTDRWNREIIWANTSSTTNLTQRRCTPAAFEESQRGYNGALSNWGITLNLAKQFYTDNGVPIDEDRTWNFQNRYNLRRATENEKLSIKSGYTTAEFNFNREHRFYGSLGFDGGIWYGNGKYNENDLYWLEMKAGQFMGKAQVAYHPVTGIFPKKLVYVTNTHTNRNTYSTTNYPWVMLRLADLYLLYAEALNEAYGPDSGAIQYLDIIRERAGLKGVKESWTNYSINPSKFTTKEGLREIIHQERTIELMAEGQRFWDLRRWKMAPIELNSPLTGWDMNQSEAELYYRERVLINQTFSFKDYFWPIREHNLVVNKNLLQSPGW